MRQPLPVLFVGLVPLAVLHFDRIGQIHREAIFENVENRFPVRTRALHRHMRHLLIGQPLPQPVQFAANREKLPDFHPWFLIEWSHHNADCKNILADIDTRTSLDCGANHYWFLSDGQQPASRSQLLPRPNCSIQGCATPARPVLFTGEENSRRYPRQPSCPLAVSLRPPAPIFISMGGRQVMDVLFCKSSGIRRALGPSVGARRRKWVRFFEPRTASRGGAARGSATTELTVPELGLFCKSRAVRSPAKMASFFRAAGLVCRNGRDTQ